MKYSLLLSFKECAPKRTQLVEMKFCMLLSQLFEALPFIIFRSIEFAFWDPLLQQLQVFWLYESLGKSCILPPSQLWFGLKMITAVNIRGRKPSDALHYLCLVLVLHVAQLSLSYERFWSPELHFKGAVFFFSGCRGALQEISYLPQPYCISVWSFPCSWL